MGLVVPLHAHHTEMGRNLRKHLLWSVLLLSTGCGKAQLPTASSHAGLEQDSARLSGTRWLRRVYLTLLGTEPGIDAYAEMRSASTDDARAALIQRAIDDALSSPRFYQQMVIFGHDYLQTGPYNFGTIEETCWTGGMGIEITPCPAGTRHAGKLGILRPPQLDNIPPDGDGIIRYLGIPISTWGDPLSLCASASAQVNTVEPWWAPGTTVQTIGRAGTGVVTSGIQDCGRGEAIYVDINNHSHLYAPDEGCSCGPNLVYCAIGARYDTPGPPLEQQPPEGRYTMANSQRRSTFEEPARLFAHVITNDKPFSDLVLGDYTVVNQKLQHIYVRLARMNSDNRALDNSHWWQSISDPNEWRELPFAAMHPNLLPDRSYHFDPRSSATPAGVPSAGVLTTLGQLGTFARERVSAARWLQIFACYNFTAPVAGQQFPPLDRDPASTGQCSHCHQVIDPAAVFFKRFGFEPGYGEFYIGGIGPWRWPEVVEGDPFGRWNNTLIHDTVLTPVSDADIARNADARFIDFLGPQSSLLGRSSDGTIGSLGFGKLLVDSGEFDRCAVQQLYERFMGRRIDLETERDLLAALVTKFVDGQRKVKPFIRYLVAQDAFSRGL